MLSKARPFFLARYHTDAYRVLPPSSPPSNFEYLPKLGERKELIYKTGRGQIALVENGLPLSTIRMYLPYGTKYEDAETYGCAQWLKRFFIQNPLFVREVELQHISITSEVTRDHIVITGRTSRENSLGLLELLHNIESQRRLENDNHEGGRVHVTINKKRKLAEQVHFDLQEAAGDVCLKLENKLFELAYGVGVGNPLNYSEDHHIKLASLNSFLTRNKNDVTIVAFNVPFPYFNDGSQKGKESGEGSGIKLADIAELTSKSKKVALAGEIETEEQHAKKAAPKFIGDNEWREFNTHDEHNYVSLGYPGIKFTSSAVAPYYVLIGLLNSRTIPYGNVASYASKLAESFPHVKFSVSPLFTSEVGLLSVNLDSSESLIEATDKWIELLKGLKQASISAEQFEAAKAVAKINLSDSLDHQVNYADLLAFQLENHKTSEIEALYEKIDKVTLEEVQKIADKVFSVSPVLCGYGNPFKIPQKRDLSHY